MFYAALEHGAARHRLEDAAARMWDGWAADIGREFPGWDVTHDLTGFRAERDGDVIRSSSPSGMRSVLALEDPP